MLLKFYFRTFINVDKILSTCFQHNRNVIRHSPTEQRGSNKGQNMWLILIRKTGLDDSEAANIDNEIPCTFVSSHNFGEPRSSYSLIENDIGHMNLLTTYQEKLLGLHVTDDLKIKTYSQSNQLVRMSLVTYMLQSVACAPSHSLTRSLACLRRILCSLETHQRNFI